jgi:uncharacterized membrane protein
MNVIKIALIVVLVLLLMIVALRMRKLRRDEMRSLERRTDPRLVVPPPSPYKPSKGFRLLDENETPSSVHAPVRPRLEPDQNYVFSDFHPAHVDSNPLSPARHDEEWALSRSATRSSLSLGGMRLVVVVVVIVLVLGFVGYYARDKINHHPSHATTTSTRSVTTTTTTTPTTKTTAAG